MYHDINGCQVFMNMWPAATANRDHIYIAVFVCLLLEFGTEVAFSTCQQNIHGLFSAGLISIQAKPVKMRISTILLQQLRVRTGLNNAAGIHHDDAVRMLNGRQAVRNDQ